MILNVTGEKTQVFLGRKDWRQIIYEKALVILRENTVNSKVDDAIGLLKNRFMDNDTATDKQTRHDDSCCHHSYLLNAIIHSLITRNLNVTFLCVIIIIFVSFLCCFFL